MIGDVARLAPDAVALGAAQRIAVRHLWPVLGRSERALWGEHEGSARYQVVVDLADHAGKCTCPSRKLPCKHVLALMLMGGDGLGLAPEPDWVAGWIDKRQAARVPKEKGPVKDVEAQMARREQREARVSEGIERLDRFFEDIMRQGLGRLDGAAGEALLETEARRLVDAQAGGLAGRMRGVAGRISGGGDWAGGALDRLGRMALLSEAWHRLESLPTALQADVRALIGFSFPEEEVLAHADLATDNWFVLADTTELDLQLKTGRTWLRGRTSGRDALILRFAPAGATFGETFLPGSELPATLAFYPSAHPQRALVVQKGPPLAPAPREAPRRLGVGELLAAWAEALAEQPWLPVLPVVLGPVEVAPGPASDARAFDASGALPIAVADLAELLALAGGRALDLMGEWNGDRLAVLGAMADGALTPLAPVQAPPPELSSRFGDLAVLGTVKRRVAMDAELEALDGPPERRVLLAAGAEAIRRSAGRLAGPPPEPLPAAPPETRRAVPPGLAQRVEALLGDPHLASEVVAALARDGFVLPPHLLSRALPFARAGAGRRPELLAVLGERGRWLADVAAAPAWVEAYRKDPHVEDPERVFLEGASDARRAALTELRRRDPAAARALLQKTWREDKPDLRLDWIDAVGAHALGPDDVAFLEAIAGHDRSQPVRRRARALLGEIPGTAVHERLRARVAAVCRPGRLDLPTPVGDAPPDAEWLDDGIAFDGAAALGARAALLAGLAKAAPPALWADASGLGPGPLVDALGASEHVHAWLLGLASRPLDATWATAVAHAIPGLDWPSALRATRDALAPALLDQVPEPARDRLRARWYQKSPQVPFKDWGPELSRAVLRTVEHLGPYDQPPAALPYELHPSLLAFALDIPQIRAGRGGRYVAAVLELRRVFHQELLLARNAR